MWTKFDETMVKHTSPKPNFKGFMVDNVQANWNALFTILGTQVSGWLTRSIHVCSTKFNCLIYTPNNYSKLSYRISTRPFATI